MFTDNDSEFLRETYQLKEIEQIGEGSFGKVFKAIDLVDNTICAVKVIGKQQFKYQTLEVDLYKHLNHKNIVQCKRIVESKKNYYIVMEYMDQGTLANLMNTKTINEDEASVIMQQILEGVQYLHEQQIIHRDLKPENILIKNGQVKIGDFGLSFKFSTGQSIFNRFFTKKCGTIIYMAPEQFIEKYYSKSVDAWSCGIILYMLLNCGKHPFYNNSDNRQEVIAKITSLNYQIKYEISELALDLLQKLLKQSPINRYNIGQAIKHPWVTRKSSDLIPLTYLEQIELFQSEQRIQQLFRNIVFLKFLILISKTVTPDSILEESLKSYSEQKNNQNQTKFKILQVSNKFINKTESTPKIVVNKILDFSLTQKFNSKRSTENSLLTTIDENLIKSNRLKVGQCSNRYFIQQKYSDSNKIKHGKQYLPPIKTK